MPRMRPACDKGGWYLFDAVVLFGYHGNEPFFLGLRNAATLLFPTPTAELLLVSEPKLVSVGFLRV
jgi:hypothetical protein